MDKVRRVYAEKKPEYAVQARELLEEIRSYLGISGINSLRMLNRYDVENLDDAVFEQALQTVFSEPPVDLYYLEELPLREGERSFSVEFLPGQFDQRADSAVQCIKLLDEKQDPVLRSALTYILSGSLSEEDFQAIQNYCVNPVDSRKTGETKPETLQADYPEPERIRSLTGFSKLSEEEFKALYASLNLAMTLRDFEHIRSYFRDEEKRDPTITEIRVLDTYWSDHCRHTTFLTELTGISFAEGEYRAPIEGAYKQYLKEREILYKGRDDKYVCLMDLALLAMKKLKAEGKLNDQEESEEINACSIVASVDVDGKEEEWLINFKNETHNHPTEIEPFGGAATCLGGAIRDPLSGRTYVYQAMRVTGAADPLVSVKDTLKGKLPQKKLVRQAARGYSSYGNQIGLATGYVKEIYHPGYVAKRMEIGAVLGAAPRRAVIRKTSDPGDIIILLGGRTGRDGIGGATGSSKVHTESSIEVCGAEVQKGNAPTERKLQRMFRREEVSRLIKKCNDFGAGGVSVAIGELAAGIKVDLDKVPKKYAGLDGTELAISESQERMAVVVSPENAEQFLAYAGEENLEAVPVAEVTQDPRLVLYWRGEKIVDLSRAFLDTNGAHQEAEVFVELPEKEDNPFKKTVPVRSFKETLLSTLSDLNVCSQRGLVEMFDSSIGAGTVLMPYGGRYQLTETQTMVAKVPVRNKETSTVSMMSYGFDPCLSSWSPFHGAVYAVTESVSRIVASGGDHSSIRLTFQEYFRRMTQDPRRWSQPVAALLGAFTAQLGLSIPSIGGKDSMSGTFQDLDVPPTLVSFAVDMARIGSVISPELKKAGSRLYHIAVPKDEYDLPLYDSLMERYDLIQEAMKKGRILSAYVTDRHGIAAAACKMAFGNGFGIRFDDELSAEELFRPAFGDLLVEVPPEDRDWPSFFTEIGRVTEEAAFVYPGRASLEKGSASGKEEVLKTAGALGEAAAPSESLSMKEALEAWTGTLEPVFRTQSAERQEESVLTESTAASQGKVYLCRHKTAKPRVFIPVFPGTNCEYDSEKAFLAAGADVDVRIFCNRDAQDIRDSVRHFEEGIQKAQILMFPGGFSAGDEPDGSAKFFATAFRNEKIKEAVMDLLYKRDGLCLGICNGFQALIKLGLVPYGEILPQKADSPTLTYNTIGRHVSRMVYTKVASTRSPWLQKAVKGAVYCSPASHGEGRFVAGKEWIRKLIEQDQIATRYVSVSGELSLNDERWNVNGSYYGIEGITSPDGRVLGKMAHVERRGPGVAMNICGDQDPGIFESGVEYFL